MIAKMTKYDFVLLSAAREDFLGRLQRLGLVDITVRDWEPSESERDMLLSVEEHRKAVERLSALAAQKDFRPGTPFDTGEEAFAKYREAVTESEELRGRIARLEKEAAEAEVWGDFSAEQLAALAANGVQLRFFSAYEADFDKQAPAWSENHAVEAIATVEGVTYFVVAGAPGQEVLIDAQELKAPTAGADAKRAEADRARAELGSWEEVLARCAASIGKIAANGEAVGEQLQLSKAGSGSDRAADGTLTVLEGWAPEESAAEVDALLEEYPGVVWLKSRPTPEDDTPVLLKNNRFARLFELIGSMYALPKYGTVDLTPLFAPFYMLFFAICLNDAGYGLLLLAAGVALLLKGGEKLKRAAALTVVCGTATVLFGFYSNSFFGMEISAVPMFEGFRFLNFQQDFFSIALAMGVVQILLGMSVNIYTTSRLFGFRYALGTLGWFLLILSACLAGGLSMLDERWTIPGFTTSSPAFYAAVGVSLVLMLFFNSPGKNIFVNFGSGLWNTYNHITGILSDVLSYIRLFAIGLSGGVLAQVFNSLALGLTGLDGGISGPWWAVTLQILGASAILLVGHGINLFMSAISSFVHPMRLTFVEFYNNAGFEAATRVYEPLRKAKISEKDN